MKRSKLSRDRHSTTAGRLPIRILLVLALVGVPVGLALATVVGREAWKAVRKVEAKGVVMDARVVHQPQLSTRRTGTWLKEWQVEYDTGSGKVRRWFPVRHYRTERSAQATQDVGKSVSVWHRPGSSGDATLEAPRVIRHTLWAGCSAVVGAFGVLGLWAWVRRGVLP